MFIFLKMTCKSTIPVVHTLIYVPSDVCVSVDGFWYGGSAFGRTIWRTTRGAPGSFCQNCPHSGIRIPRDSRAAVSLECTLQPKDWRTTWKFARHLVISGVIETGQQMRYRCAGQPLSRFGPVGRVGHFVTARCRTRRDCLSILSTTRVSSLFVPVWIECWGRVNRVSKSHWLQMRCPTASESAQSPRTCRALRSIWFLEIRAQRSGYQKRRTSDQMLWAQDGQRVRSERTRFGQVFILISGTTWVCTRTTATRRRRRTTNYQVEWCSSDELL